MDRKQSIKFVSGNKGKLAEVQAFLPFVIGASLDLPEIQDVNPHTVVSHKLVSAATKLEGPILVDDTALYLDCFASKTGDVDLPGPFIKWFLKTITNKGLADMACELGKTGARASTIIGYFDGRGNSKFFEGSVSGTIVQPQGTSGFGWDHIFVPCGQTQTFARMGIEKKNRISPRAHALAKLKDFLL